MIRLPRPPEFVDTQEYFQNELKRTGNGTLVIAAIKQGTWFTKPYWDMYKKELKIQGVTWQILMKAFKLCSYKFIDWVKKRESWERCISCLENAINTLLKTESMI